MTDQSLPKESTSENAALQLNSHCRGSLRRSSANSQRIDRRSDQRLCPDLELDTFWYDSVARRHTDLPPLTCKRIAVSSDHLNSAILRAALIVLMILGIPVMGVLVYLNIQKSGEKPVPTQAKPVQAEPVQAEPAQ